MINIFGSNYIYVQWDTRGKVKNKNRRLEILDREWQKIWKTFGEKFLLRRGQNWKIYFNYSGSIDTNKPLVKPD